MREILPLLLIDEYFLVEVHSSHISLLEDLALFAIEVHLCGILFVQLLPSKWAHLLQKFRLVRHLVRKGRRCLVQLIEHEAGLHGDLTCLIQVRTVILGRECGVHPDLLLATILWILSQREHLIGRGALQERFVHGGLVVSWHAVLVLHILRVHLGQLGVELFALWAELVLGGGLLGEGIYGDTGKGLAWDVPGPALE